MATDSAFLGRGWRFPPRFSRGGAHVETVAGTEDVHQSLQILFATRLGERVMQENFGTGLASNQFAEIDQRLVNDVRQTITNAVLYFEPRIRLDELDVSTSDAEQGLLLIHLTYSVRSTNSRFNMVYPFYLLETSANPAQPDQPA